MTKKIILVVVLISLSFSSPVFAMDSSTLDDYQSSRMNQLAFSNTIEDEQSNKLVNTSKEDSEDVSEDEPEIIKPAIILAKKSAEIELGQTVQIDAKLSPESLENETLIYKSMDEKIAVVNSSGLVQSKGLGKTKIMITYVANEPLELVFDLEVRQVTGTIDFKEQEFYLIRGLTYQIPFTIKGNIDSNLIKWTSSDASVASVDNGNILGLKLGKTTISAEYQRIRSSMIFYVTAPIEKIEFSKDSLTLAVGETQSIPTLIYVPYDTTSNKDAEYRSSDEAIFKIEAGEIVGSQVGEAYLIASVGKIETRVLVKVNHQKSPTGADVIDLVIESQNDNQMILVVKNFDNYKADRYALNLPKLEIINFLDNNEQLDIFIVLEDIFIENNFKKLDNLLLDSNILENLDDKKLSVHLLDSKNNPLIIYHFTGNYTHSLDLKYHIETVSQRDDLYQKIQGKSYFLRFNKNNGDSKFKVELSSKLIDSGFSQMHFIYQVKNQELVDTKQDVVVNSQDRIVFDVDDTLQIITFNRLAISSSDNMVYWMLGILLTVGIGISAYYANQMKKNRNV